MNFDLSEDDAALQDSVARWVQQRYPFDARRKLAAQAPGFSREHWREMAQLGWLALPFDEALGGLGGGALGTMLMMEELGKGLVLEPLPAERAAVRRPDAAQRARCATIGCPKVIDGSVLGALACLERDSRHELADVQTTLRPAGDGYLLNGDKALVFNGAAADQLIVSARSGGGRFDEAGISLVRVDADATGVERTALQLMDGQWVANLRFTRRARGGLAAAVRAGRRFRAAARHGACGDAGAVRRGLRHHAGAAGRPRWTTSRRASSSV